VIGKRRSGNLHTPAAGTRPNISLSNRVAVGSEEVAESAGETVSLVDSVPLSRTGTLRNFEQLDC
jgi:hypothetical protein